MAYEPWNGNPVKPGNWGTWAQIETPRTDKKPSCYSCSFCDSDGGCRKKGVVISEVGKNAYKSCKYYDGIKPQKKTQTKIKPLSSETKRFIVDENHHLINATKDYLIGMHEIESILLQQVVRHRTYGRGVIVSYKKRLMGIRFKQIKQIRKYRWPDSFLEGFIIPVGEAVKKELEYVKVLNGLK